MGYSAQLFMRKDYEKKDGSFPIYLRIILNRKKKDFSLSVSVRDRCWNGKKCEVKFGDSNSIRKNLILQKYYQKATSIFFNCIIQEKLLTFYDFEKQFKGNTVNRRSFYEFVDKQINVYDGKLSKGTLHVYSTQLSKLKKFRSEVFFGQIDVSFLKEYENYMINDLKNNENTRSKSLSFIKNILNKAIQEGLLTENVFNKAKFEIKNIRGDREHLSNEELEQLEELFQSQVLKANKQNVLKYFLFSCYTGLRYSDMKRLKHKHIINGVIKIITQKTKQLVEIPLSNQAAALIEKGPNELTIFNVLSDQPTNRYLKDICKFARINKNISFHCARHTFATLSLEKGIEIEILQKLMGHSDIKETLIYAKISNKMKTAAIQKWHRTK